MVESRNWRASQTLVVVPSRLALPAFGLETGNLKCVSSLSCVSVDAEGWVIFLGRAASGKSI